MVEGQVTHSYTLVFHIEEVKWKPVVLVVVQVDFYPCQTYRTCVELTGILAWVTLLAHLITWSGSLLGVTLNIFWDGKFDLKFVSLWWDKTISHKM